MGESKPEPKPDKKRVTLRDVAEEAGVSLKTASNVINHSGRMTDSTREKVQEVIDLHKERNHSCATSTPPSRTA